MGRQIQIAATSQDENAFLSFLSKTANIAIFGMFTESKEALWVETFHADLMGHWTYSIWNQQFAWTPEYSQTKDKGLFYISNSHVAPVIEFTRSDVTKQKYGRIYWGKDFSAPQGLGYDVKTFAKWFDRIVRWVRKEGLKAPDDSYSPFFLPDAWKIYKHAQQSLPVDG